MSLFFSRIMGRIALSGVLIVLAGCTTTHGPLYGPGSPRNGASDVVDSQTGVVIPGWPTGGGDGAGGRM